MYNNSGNKQKSFSFSAHHGVSMRYTGVREWCRKGWDPRSTVPLSGVGRGKAAERGVSGRAHGSKG